MAYRLREELEEVEVLEVAVRDRTFRAFPSLPDDARVDLVLGVLPAAGRARPPVYALVAQRGGVWFVGTTSGSPGAPFLAAYASDERLEVARRDLARERERDRGRRSP